MLAKDDFIVANVEGKTKPILLKIRLVKESRLVGVVPDITMDTNSETTYRVTYDDIVVALGNQPPPGRVYGVKVEPIYRVDTVKGWGTVRVHRWMEKDDLAPLYSRMSKWGPKLLDSGVLYPHWETDVRPPKGKWAGTYHYRPKQEMDLVEFHTDIAGQDLDHLIIHEMGHNTWFRLLADRHKVKWIELYEQYVEVQTVKSDAVERIISDLGAFSGSAIRDYTSDLSEEEKDVADAILGHVYDVHNLRVHHVDLILATGGSIAAYLPRKSELKFGKAVPPVTEYAGKAPEELFAEVFALYHLKKPLPKECQRLMRRSLRSITGGTED